MQDLQHLLSVLYVSGPDICLKIYWYLFVRLQYADKKMFASSTLSWSIRTVSSSSFLDIRKSYQTIFSQTIFTTSLFHRLIGLGQRFFSSILNPGLDYKNSISFRRPYYYFSSTSLTLYPFDGLSSLYNKQNNEYLQSITVINWTAK